MTNNMKAINIIVAALLLMTPFASQGQCIANGTFNAPNHATPFPNNPATWIPNFGWFHIFSGSPLYTGGNTFDVLSPTGILPAFGIAGYDADGNDRFVSGIYNPGSAFREGVEQTVTCLEIGTTYELTFAQSVVMQVNLLDRTGSWEVYVDNNLLGVSAPTTSTAVDYLDINLNWEYRTMTFTATATSHLFSFVPVDDDLISTPTEENVRMGLDDVALVPLSSTLAINPAAPVCVTDPNFTLSTNSGSSVGTWSGTGIIDASTGEFDPSVAGTGTHTVTYTPTCPCGLSPLTIDIDATDCTLPVELLEFNAEAVNENKVALTWTTVNEINNDYFEIERSRDGTSFGTIATVDGAGTSNITLHYNDFDEDPYNGISYYRLKQTDFDGTYTYSDIRTVIFDDLSFVNMHPNPATEDLQFTVMVSEDADLHVHIVDVMGRVIMQEDHFIEAGESTITLNVASLASGMYTIRVNTNNENHLSKEFIRR